ncbi:TPA: hypothetical protein NIK39_006678, partial [Pseudomonas aeruginosa]|nr:hypothetical protein [Pseudomonas aeruginosa]
LVERRDLGENQLRQLAQRFLADHGVKVPRTSHPTPIHQQPPFELT